MAGDLEDRINRRLREAEDAIKTEVRRTRTEERAFNNFVAKVRNLEPSHSSDVAARNMVQSVSVDTSPNHSRLRDAYESTVMAVPHYKEDYGDTFEESFAAEFGSALARAILKEPGLDNRQKTILLAKSQKAWRDRLQFIKVLETERESIQTLSEKVMNLTAEIETLHEETGDAATFGSYDAIRSGLFDIESDCETLISSRQETLNDQRKDLSLPDEAPDIPTYIYAELDTSHPILSSIADIISEIEMLRIRVERGMAYVN